MKAVKTLQDEKKHSPDEPATLVALGRALEKLQKNDKARKIFKKALSSDPTNVHAHQGLARLNLRGPHYLEALKRIHANLRPSTYVEVGIREGNSFRLADPAIPAVGIDPKPLVDETTLPERHLIIKDTSDNYFQSDRLTADLGGQPVDLAFIDGMHLFEFALRDFVALERTARATGTIVVHDCYPFDEITSSRERKTPFWSGDVWKIILCLKQYRPDLEVHTLPCPPTGLAVISGLDPSSTVLADSLEMLCELYIPMSFSAIREDQKRKLNLMTVEQALDCHYLKG